MGRLDAKSIGSGVPVRVRSFEAKQSFPAGPEPIGADHPMEDRTQPGGKLLIEEFYEYGGKAVCSNHVFNFKIGKFAFAQYFN